MDPANVDKNGPRCTQPLPGVIVTQLELEETNQILIGTYQTALGLVTEPSRLAGIS